MSLYESIVEDTALGWFEELGYVVVHEPQMAPGELARSGIRLARWHWWGACAEAIRRSNPAIPHALLQ